VIPHSYLTRIADTQDVDARTVERDYLLTHVLAAISRQPGSHGMIFKGGTALRLCYFEGYRYSADLDFSLQADANPAEALESVDAATRYGQCSSARHSTRTLTPNNSTRPSRSACHSGNSRWGSEMSEHLAGEPEPFKAVERSVHRVLRSKLRSS
jgi:hypothetical protein